ncbi:mannitol operon transcriptional antiterminator [Sediminibacillus albus]|uniref:Mannitol operon transcriptional antiterminator n=1 Tax=Sediminibacillus albus TaxID=407036 RepID=A0A1G8WSV2_9BACI|nr:mannitol operon transcriptional antiterminator [Sediminibacillus albus]
MSAQDMLTIKKLADHLEVSARTVHRDLKSVEAIIAEYDLTMDKKSGVGLQIIGTAENKSRLELVLFNVKHTDYTPEERQTIILSTLLETNEPIKLFALADELQVTVATVSHDLDKIEENISGFHLSLIRKRGYGVKVDGREADKRAALSYLITQHLDEFDFISMLRENIQKKSKQQADTISARLLGLVDRDRLMMIEKRVERLREELPYELADSAYIGLVVHLALAIERLQKGDNIQFDADNLEQLKGTREYNIALKMIRDLGTAMAIEIPDDEIGYITMHLMGAKLRVDHEYLIEDTSLDIAVKAKELIRFIGVKLDIDMTDNSRLLNDLVAHLKPTIYRLKQEMSIKNPMIEEIRHDYQQLFRLLEEGVDTIFPEVHFPEEEIGYLVLHFAAVLLDSEEELRLNALVICSSGIGTAKMLATRLKQQIPEINQVNNKSLFELEKLNLHAYDLVVSTIPLKGINREYILASPILTQSDVHKIEKFVRRRKISQKTDRRQKQEKDPENQDNADVVPRLQAMQEYSKAILALLDGFHVRQLAGERTLPKVLTQICSKLAKEQVLENEQRVSRKLLERERLGGLGIPNTSLALYHTRSNDILKPCFAIYPLSHPLTVQGMDGEDMDIKHILLMLAPDDTSQEVLEILSYLSGLVIKDKKSIQLFQSGNEAKIRQFIAGQLNQLINEKI